MTIDCHIEDLHQLLASFPHSVGLVGASWGAMLALAYAASHWERADPLVLIGCGTFNEHSRAQMHQTLAERMTPELRAQIKQTDLDILSPDERLENLAHLLLPVYSVELITSTLESAGCDAVGHQESWADMMEHQKTGRYPQAFSSISAPVLMLHGSADPHPGMMIRDSLKPWLPHLEYHEWEQCGHYPWLERAVKKDFYHTLTSWLHQHLPTASH